MKVLNSVVAGPPPEIAAGTLAYIAAVCVVLLLPAVAGPVVVVALPYLALLGSEVVLHADIHAPSLLSVVVGAEVVVVVVVVAVGGVLATGAQLAVARELIVARLQSSHFLW